MSGRSSFEYFASRRAKRSVSIGTGRYVTSIPNLLPASTRSGVVQKTTSLLRSADRLISLRGRRPPAFLMSLPCRITTCLRSLNALKIEPTTHEVGLFDTTTSKDGSLARANDVDISLYVSAYFTFKEAAELMPMARKLSGSTSVDEWPFLAKASASVRHTNALSCRNMNRSPESLLFWPRGCTASGEPARHER